MTRQELIQQIWKKHTYLCVGLDPDLTQMPHHLRHSPDCIVGFCIEIINATADFCVSYKINTAFFEQYGAPGWAMMQQVMAHIPPTHFIIADAKRGDIGNTSAAYARAFFEALPAHAVTIAPYMGSDSVLPFLKYKNKWAIILALTSNQSATDFELLRTHPSGDFLYHQVINTAKTWGNINNTMFVVGATHPEAFAGIRQRAPHHFLLVPGVGAQGGSLRQVSQHALIPHDIGILINASRSVIYASTRTDFAQAARQQAQKIANEMAEILSDYFTKLLT